MELVRAPVSSFAGILISPGYNRTFSTQPMILGSNRLSANADEPVTMADATIPRSAPNWPRPLTIGFNLTMRRFPQYRTQIRRIIIFMGCGTNRCRRALRCRWGARNRPLKVKQWRPQSQIIGHTFGSPVSKWEADDVENSRAKQLSAFTEPGRDETRFRTFLQRVAERIRLAAIVKRPGVESIQHLTVVRLELYD